MHVTEGIKQGFKESPNKIGFRGGAKGKYKQGTAHYKT